MKKPDWFELTDGDDRGLRVVNKVPHFVFVIIAILVAGIVFMFPSYNSKDVTPKPTIAEIIIEEPSAINSPEPNSKIKNPSIGTMPNGSENEDDESEDEEEEDDD